ncbi:MAG: hypothetical protein V3V09_07380, partial [Arenicellales bacterium]
LKESLTTSMADAIADMLAQLALSGIKDILSSVFNIGGGSKGGFNPASLLKFGNGNGTFEMGDLVPKLAPALGKLLTGTSATGAGSAAAGASATGAAAGTGSFAAAGGAAALGSVLLPVALAIGVKAHNKKRRAERAKEYSGIANSGSLTGGVEGAYSLKGFGVGANGGAEAFLNTLQLSTNEVRALDGVIEAMGGSVWRGADGWQKVTGDVAVLGDLTQSLNQEAITMLDDRIAKQIELNTNGLEGGEIAQMERETREQITKEYAKSFDLINGADFSKFAKAITSATGVSAKSLKQLGSDGYFTAQEINQYFGNSASGIIEGMGGASEVTAQKLLEIVSAAELSSKGISSAFGDAAKKAIGELGGIGDAVSKIPKDFNITGTVNYKNNGSNNPANGAGGDEFSTGTNGWLKVPYDGYSPTFHAGEEFYVKNKRQVGQSAQTVNGGGEDMRGVERHLEQNNRELRGIREEVSSQTLSRNNATRGLEDRIRLLETTFQGGQA